jgi:hypothetical protein
MGGTATTRQRATSVYLPAATYEALRGTCPPNAGSTILGETSTIAKSWGLPMPINDPAKKAALDGICSAISIVKDVSSIRGSTAIRTRN